MSTIKTQKLSSYYITGVDVKLYSGKVKHLDLKFYKSKDIMIEKQYNKSDKMKELILDDLSKLSAKSNDPIVSVVKLYKRNIDLEK